MEAREVVASEELFSCKTLLADQRVADPIPVALPLDDRNEVPVRTHADADHGGQLDGIVEGSCQDEIDAAKAKIQAAIAKAEGH